MRFVTALSAQIKLREEQSNSGKTVSGLKDIAMALAAIDGRNSAAVVLDIIAKPGEWDYYSCVEAAERLLIAGAVLTTTAVFALVDAFLKRTDRWMDDSDRYLLRRMAQLCAFVDDPAAGIAKIREVLVRRPLRAYELRGLVTALGESRSKAASELICELASEKNNFDQCEDCFINSLATLNDRRARELLVGFVDPESMGITFPGRFQHEEILVARLAGIAREDKKVAARLLELCETDLPESKRHLLSKVLNSLGTGEALVANLRLINDKCRPSVPHGIWKQLDTTVVEERPYGDEGNVFTKHARASNELRARLFRMTLEDNQRRKSASMLLGQIEIRRLEYGRPAGEPRHPDLASGQRWPAQLDFSV